MKRSSLRAPVRILATGLAGGLVFTALAAPAAGLRGPQHDGDRPPREARAERLAAFLDLNATQRDAAREIHEETRDRLEPLREQVRSLQRELRTALEAEPRDATAVGRLAGQLHDTVAQLRAVHESARDRLAGTLEGEQREKFETLVAWREERREGRREGGRGGD